MNSGKPALTTLLAKLLDRSDFRSEKSLYFAKLREKGVFVFFYRPQIFFLTYNQVPSQMKDAGSTREVVAKVRSDCFMLL